MIAGTGVDLVCISDFARLLADEASAFVPATFTAAERAYCTTAASGAPAQHFAARYAAKEATVKALDQACAQAGLTVPALPLRCIELCRDPQGRPHLALHSAAHALAVRLGIDRAWVSLSHDGDVALASVVVERFA